MNIFIWLTILFITTIVFGKENILFIISTLIISILLVYIYRKLSFRKILFYGILSLIFILCVDFIFNEVFEQRHRDRFDIVLGIKEDNRGIGYNTNQSQLAFKSGGFFGEGFLKGIRLYDFPNITTPYFWANTSNCFHRLTNYTWNVTPHYLNNVTLVGPSPWDKWSNTTYMSQILADALFVCNDMNKNAYKYIIFKKELFGGWTLFSYSFI